MQKLRDRVLGVVRKYPWIVPVLVVLLVFWRLPLTFFEQDEWQAFEVYIGASDKSIIECVSVQRPLTCFINTLEWRTFGTNATYYGLFSLLLISLIVVVFYRLLRRFEIPETKSVIIASIMPLFVAGSQAITWFGAFSASLPNFLFALLAIDFLLIAMKTQLWRWQVASLLMVALSLYFKEESLWVIPVMIVTWWAYAWQKKLPRDKKSLLRYVGPIVAAILIYLLLERTRQMSGSSFGGLVSTTDPTQYVRDVFKSLFFLPFHHLSHILVGPENITSLTAFFTMKTATISALITTAMLVGLAGLLRFSQSPYRPAIFVLAAWSLTGFVSYAVFGKNPEYLEGRYYFGTQAAVAALLVIGLLPDKIKNIRSFNTFGTAVLVLILLLNLTLLDRRIDRSLAIAKERRNILSFIQEHTGPLPKKAIIYTETNNYGYVGQDANILPFQNGIGTTLRVMYQGKDQDYRQLAKKQLYLWDILAQGYDEVDGIGFGYYREMDKLTHAMADNKLTAENIFAFRYAGTKMIDMTKVLRGKLSIFSKELIQVPRNQVTVTSNDVVGVDEKHGIEKVTDNDPKSDWAVSQQPGDYIEVDLGEARDNIAKFVMKTADGNSYPKEYKFEYSVDGTNWIEAFSDIGTLNADAETVIVFEPTTMKKIRLTLLADRGPFFAWSVSDINVFAVKK